MVGDYISSDFLFVVANSCWIYSNRGLSSSINYRICVCICRPATHTYEPKKTKQGYKKRLTCMYTYDTRINGRGAWRGYFVADDDPRSSYFPATEFKAGGADDSYFAYGARGRRFESYREIEDFM